MKDKYTRYNLTRLKWLWCHPLPVLHFLKVPVIFSGDKSSGKGLVLLLWPWEWDRNTTYNHWPSGRKRPAGVRNCFIYHVYLKQPRKHVFVLESFRNNVASIELWLTKYDNSMIDICSSSWPPEWYRDYSKLVVNKRCSTKGCSQTGGPLPPVSSLKHKRLPLLLFAPSTLLYRFHLLRRE